jgi:hypothetical protein
MIFDVNGTGDKETDAESAQKTQPSGEGSGRFAFGFVVARQGP